MTEILVYAAATAILVAAAVWEWRNVKRRERLAHADAEVKAMLDRKIAVIVAGADAMQRAMTDDHTCDVCRQVSAIRELVHLHDDATLACPSCAALLKGVAA